MVKLGGAYEYEPTRQPMHVKGYVLLHDEHSFRQRTHVVVLYLVYPIKQLSSSHVAFPPISQKLQLAAQGTHDPLESAVKVMEQSRQKYGLKSQLTQLASLQGEHVLSVSACPE